MDTKNHNPKQKISQTEYQNTPEGLMAYYGDEELKIEYNKLKALGVDPNESQALVIKLAELGINPIEAMKAMLTA